MKHEEFACQRDGLTIRGTLSLPEGNGPFPVVINSHGLGVNRVDIDPADFTNEGIAVCTFDFCGGSPNSGSDGETTDMSVVTEVADLNAVINKLMIDDRIDEDRINLLGTSQGGFVSTVVGSQRQNDINSLFLMCPAYRINDFVKENFPRGAPDEPFYFLNMELGPKYVEDTDVYHIYDLLPGIDIPVTIYHGTDDELVPISYSRRAFDVLTDAGLIEIPGSGHTLTDHMVMIEADMIEKISNE
ncbi:MAG: alpha/beta hydrolase [Eggerthellaceae bacterium]|nr:alpha/beta hydrolase [Eggerthellaceae bacterium]